MLTATAARVEQQRESRLMYHSRAKEVRTQRFDAKVLHGPRPGRFGGGPRERPQAVRRCYLKGGTLGRPSAVGEWRAVWL